MNTRRHHLPAVLMLIGLILAGCGRAPTATVPAPSAPPATADSEATARPTAVAVATTAGPTPTSSLAPTPEPSNTPEPASPPTTAAATARPTAAGDAAVEPAALAAQVSAERLINDVRWLADDAREGRQIGSPAEDKVGAWLAERYEELGLLPFSDVGLTGYVHPFEMSFRLIPGHGGDDRTAHGENIIGILPGAVRPDNYVYVSAHYDGYGICDAGQACNGANDDATGVAAVLETARILSAAGAPPQETIVFINFSGEEVGLVGSGAFCDLLQSSGRGKPALTLNLEMLGPAQGYGTRVDVWDEDLPSTEPLVAAVQQAGEDVGFPVRRLDTDPGSDALRLIACGVPAVSVDGAWGDEPHSPAHTTEDDWQVIDVEGFARAVEVIVAAAWRLANDGE